VQGIAKGLPKQPDRQDHHAALPYSEVPGFIQALRKADASESARLAFEFLILTAARTGEVLGATWDEIDYERAIWTIPGQRMKTGRKHRVPLALRCMEILSRARDLSDQAGYVFPGRSLGKPLSNMVFLMVLRLVAGKSLVQIGAGEAMPGQQLAALGTVGRVEPIARPLEEVVHVALPAQPIAWPGPAMR
jgi:integrase